MNSVVVMSQYHYHSADTESAVPAGIASIVPSFLASYTIPSSHLKFLNSHCWLQFASLDFTGFNDSTIFYTIYKYLYAILYISILSVSRHSNSSSSWKRIRCQTPITLAQTITPDLIRFCSWFAIIRNVSNLFWYLPFKSPNF